MESDRNVTGTDFSEIEEQYSHWREFMEQNVEFRFKESELHTKEHCSRVLMFSLLIARKLSLGKTDQNALAMAACFHDSRRHDDWIDTGHGQRAADYYREFCDETGLLFDLRTYYIIAYHDRDDSFGMQVIADNFRDFQVPCLLYQIFKDADALDRFRLGPFGLNEKYLRTDAARSLVNYARSLYEI